jgi:hypothetical protein
MNKEFIPYEQSLELKELGFDEPCLKYWDGIGEYFDQKDWFNWNQVEKFVSIPLYQQAFRWFRDKYKLFGCIDLHISTPTHWYIRIDDIIKNDYMYHSEDENLKYNTYEEAELACLNKLIQIIKTK